MNKQPFYHEVSFLFTATSELDGDSLRELFESEVLKSDAFKEHYVPDTCELHFCDGEPGDPADLM